MAKILILGGGFGGLIVAERLATELDPTHDITVVAPNRKFTFYPGLVHLAFGECDADDITFDLAAKLKSIGVRYVQGEMIELDSSGKKAVIAGEDISGEIHYDFLVLAIGRRLATGRVPGFFEYSSHLLGTGAAIKFGQAVRNFDRGRIIVGLCPGARLPVPVCETAFALAKMFEKQIAGGEIDLSVIFPESLQSSFGGASLHKELENAFARHHINVLYDIPISEITPEHLISSQDHKIEYDLLMLVPPFRGNAQLRSEGIVDEEDFVLVDDRMKIAGLDSSYAVGDIVAFSGPKFAHMAVRQAEVAATNLISEINGDEPEKTYYHEIAAVIDAGGSDSIYLHYGIWDDSMYRLKKGKLWGWAKEAHDTWWKLRNR
ncbi:MAG: FAD-dependent oxidoreductase [Pyrinomonadaceae bacterium]